MYKRDISTRASDKPINTTATTSIIIIIKIILIIITTSISIFNINLGYEEVQ